MAEQKETQENEELKQQADAAETNEGEASEEDLDAVAGGASSSVVRSVLKGSSFIRANRRILTGGR